MTATIPKSIVQKLRAEETIAISVAPGSSDVAAALDVALAQVSQVGDETDPGPSWVSEAMETPHGLVVLIDANGTNRSQADEIVEILRSSLGELGTAVALKEEHGTRRFESVRDAEPVLALHAMVPYDPVLRTSSALPALCETVLGVAESLVPDPAPALIAGAPIPTTWDYLAEVGPRQQLLCIFAAEHHGLYLRAQLAHSGETDIRLLGEPLRNPETLSATALQLRNLARSLPGPPPATLIRPNLTWLEATITHPRNPDRETLMRQISPRTGASDDYAIGVGWSQTVTNALWAKISATSDLAADAEIHHLDDGRVEITFGNATDWAEWLNPTSPQRETAHRAFEPTIISHADWRPIQSEARQRMFEIYNARN